MRAESTVRPRVLNPHLLVVAALLPLHLLCGCATMVRGNEQAVTFTSEPPGARVTINSKVRGSTPGRILVERSAEPAQVTVEKEGYYPKTFVLEETTSPMLLGNILIGGVIGLGVDAASGKGEDYVGSVHVRLERRPEWDRPASVRAGDGAPSKGTAEKMRLMQRYHEGAISREEYLRQLQRIE